MLRTRLYCYCTPSHFVFRDEWFLPTVGDEYDVRISVREQVCPTGEYSSAGFAACMQEKIETILRAIEECWGGIFVFSDVDVQFFGPTRDRLLAAVEHCDIAFQDNRGGHQLCTGFFVCRANDATRNFWRAALELSRRLDIDDQKCTQQLLQDTPMVFGVAHRARLLWLSMTGRLASFVFTHPHLAVRWCLLDWKSYYVAGRYWKPGDRLNVPEGILMHHANWTIGRENKLELLRQVRDSMRAR